MAQHILKVLTNAEGTCIWLTEKGPGQYYESGWEPIDSRRSESLLQPLTEDQVNFLKSTPNGLLKIVDGIEVIREDWRK